MGNLRSLLSIRRIDIILNADIRVARDEERGRLKYQRILWWLVNTKREKGHEWGNAKEVLQYKNVKTVC